MIDQEDRAMSKSTFGNLCSTLATGVFLVLAGTTSTVNAGGQLSITSFGLFDQDAQRKACSVPFGSAMGVEVLISAARE